MSTTITRLSRYLSRGEIDKAHALVSNYRVIVSSNATIGAAQVKLLGTVLHISKAKKVAMARSVGDKKLKKDVSYHRLVFCREEGEGGKIFAIVFNVEDKQIFALSRMSVGAGIVIVKPQLEGEWAGIRVVSTPEPCLPGQQNWSAFLPNPFPDNGMISFCLVNISLKPISTGVRLTCSGRLCGGLYGDSGRCPCVKVSALPRHCLDLRLEVEGSDDEILDLRFQSYLSLELTEQLVGLDLLEKCVRRNDDELDDILEYVEKEIADGQWSLLGWFKANVSSDDGSYYVPKTHIVAMRKETAIKKYESPVSVGQDEDGEGAGSQASTRRDAAE